MKKSWNTKRYLRKLKKHLMGILGLTRIIMITKNLLIWFLLFHHAFHQLLYSNRKVWPPGHMLHHRQLLLQSLYQPLLISKMLINNVLLMLQICGPNLLLIQNFFLGLVPPPYGWVFLENFKGCRVSTTRRKILPIHWVSRNNRALLWVIIRKIRKVLLKDHQNGGGVGI